MTLVCDDGVEFGANRAVLAARSDFFRTLVLDPTLVPAVSRAIAVLGPRLQGKSNRRWTAQIKYSLC